MKKFTKIASVLTAFIAGLVMTSKNAYVEASVSSVSTALSKSGIKSTGKVDGLFTDLNNIVYLVMAVGGFWIVGMLVWGGMTLAGSGGNPQKRTEGIIKLSLVLVGAYIIFKSHSIAGWATGLGGG